MNNIVDYVEMLCAPKFPNNSRGLLELRNIDRHPHRMLYSIYKLYSMMETMIHRDIKDVKGINICSHIHVFRQRDIPTLNKVLIFYRLLSRLVISVKCTYESSTRFR